VSQRITVRFGPAATTLRTKERSGISASWAASPVHAAGLHEAELGDIAGNGNLRRGDAALFQRVHEVVLRGDLILGDRLEDRGLTGGLAFGTVCIFIHHCV
jgi:hypothetical protein